MLVFFKENLVFLAVPKTGTTAYETALRFKADIIYRKRPTLKHTPARKFKRQIAPFLDKVHDLRPETMAVIRDPLDQMGSWFRYRKKPSLDGHPNSTRDMSFETFIEVYINGNSAPISNIGSQYKFVSDQQGNVVVDHIFAYEKQRVLQDFLEDRFRTKLDIPVKNVSVTDVDLSLSPELETRLREHLSRDFALHTQTMETGHFRLS